jgi:hypothetical protein
LLRSLDNAGALMKASGAMPEKFAASPGTSTLTDCVS